LNVSFIIKVAADVVQRRRCVWGAFIVLKRQGNQ